MSKDFDYKSVNARDDDTDAEAYTALASSVSFGMINNEAVFYDLARDYDALLGHSSPNSFAITDIINDSSRSWYLYMTASLLSHTHFTMPELARVVKNMRDKILGGDGKQKKKTPATKHVRAEKLEGTILAFCQYPDFEPVWHMRKRGDDRRLPNSKDKDLWGFLNRLYMDPEYCRLRVPDNIKRMYPMYPGYEQCVKAAIKAGQTRMREIHGNNVDLTPVTDIKKKGEVDYDGIGASFISLLRQEKEQRRQGQ